MPGTDKPLQGLSLLLTRPSHQAQEWIAAFKKEGADVEHIPTMEIVAETPNSMQRDYLNNADIGIFVSCNAVTALSNHLSHVAVASSAPSESSARVASHISSSILTPQPIQPMTTWFAVGDKSAECARRAGFLLNQDAASYDTDTLLANKGMSESEVAGRQLVIVRGVGGREKLAETLRERGAMVNYCELYQRRCAWQNSQQLADCLINTPPRLLAVSSIDSLNHAFSLAEAQNQVDRLQALPMLVPGNRVAAAAREKGIEQPVISRSMRLSDVLYACKQWWMAQQGQL